MSKIERGVMIGLHLIDRGGMVEMDGIGLWCSFKSEQWKTGWILRVIGSLQLQLRIGLECSQR